MHTRSPLVDEVYFSICKTVNSPFSLMCWLLYRDDPLGFSAIEIDPSAYEDASLFQADYLVYSYLKKYDNLDIPVDKKEAALAKFKLSELQCKTANIRFLSGRKNGHPTIIAGLLTKAATYIERLLGSYKTAVPHFQYGWGKGATASIKRRDAFLDTKITELPIQVTRRALPVVREILANDLHWSSCILETDPVNIKGPFCFLPSVFKITEYSIVDTVPKNSKTDRVIAKENTLNGFLQKGIGSFIRRRLKSVGIDLNDQGANQRAAKAALTERLATLDLSMASDTIPRELISELFPTPWANALSCARSHTAMLPSGEEIYLEKFSSMGNGFTFELESLIFWALIKACENTFGKDRRVWVYGDDLIVHQDISHLTIPLLEYCGFRLNTEKSFTKGLFFESCGKHYFGGLDVTPIYQKEVPYDLEAYIRMSNRLIRYALATSTNYVLNKDVCGAWHRVIRETGNDYNRYQLPLGSEGDDAFLAPSDTYQRVFQDPNFGIRCRVRVPASTPIVMNEGALLAFHFMSHKSAGFSLLHSNGSFREFSDRGTLDKGGFFLIAKTIDNVAVYTDSTRWIIPTGEFDSNW